MEFSKNTKHIYIVKKSSIRKFGGKPKCDFYAKATESRKYVKDNEIVFVFQKQGKHIIFCKLDESGNKDLSAVYHDNKRFYEPLI